MSNVPFATGRRISIIYIRARSVDGVSELGSIAEVERPSGPELRAVKFLPVEVSGFGASLQARIGKRQSSRIN